MHDLLKVLFQQENSSAEVKMDFIDILFPDFDSKIDGIYNTYEDVELYDIFVFEYYDNQYHGQLGFTSIGDDELYGTVEWSSDENFNIKDIDWYID